jgi:hypothetical protein
MQSPKSKALYRSLNQVPQNLGSNQQSRGTARDRLDWCQVAACRRCKAKDFARARVRREDEYLTDRLADYECAPSVQPGV